MNFGGITWMYKCPKCGWEGTEDQVILDCGEDEAGWWEIESCPVCWDDGGGELVHLDTTKI